MKGLYIYDTESDGLAGKSIDPSEHMTKFHVLLFKEYGVDNWHVFLDHLHEGFREAKDFLDKKEVNLTYHKLDEVIKWLKSEPKGIACQNQFGFDLLAMTNQYGTEFDYFPERIDDHSIKMYDTLSMSRALYPDRQLPFGCPSKVKDPNGGKAKTIGPHSLEAWGYKLANLKVAIEDWRNLPLWKYCDRVFEDVLINELQFQALVKESKDGVDKGVEWKIPLQRCSQADYLMVVQEQQGVVFDQEKAWKLLEKVDAHMREIEGQVEPNLPLRQVPENQRPTFPKEPFGKDGEISHWGWKYAENVLGYKLNLEYFEHIGPPKTAFKKDGSLSKNGFNYCTKMGIADESLMPDFIREQLRKSNTLKPLEEDEMANLRKQLEDKFMPEEFLWTPMKISNQDDIKSWLVKEQGWRPTLWNTTDITKGPDKKALPDSEKEDKCWEYIKKRKDSIYAEFYRGELDDLDIRTIKRDDSNFKKLLKKGRMLPTTPKFKDERGKLCPMLELIQGDMAKLIVTWLSCRNRRSVVKSADETKTTGWLNHPRLKVDGRLPARYTGLTPTFRRKHNIVANVPSTDALYGKEMRDLYTVPKGFWQMGIDGSNLEGMVAAEAAYPFDGGAYYKSLSGDPHTTNAKAYSIAAGREVTRSGGKAITYGIMYGAQAPKIGVMLGVSKEVGQRVIEAFWNTNYGLKGCKEYLEKFWKSTGKRYILGFDKRKIYIRSQHSLLNAYLQSGGAIGMDIAGILWHKRAKEEGLLDKGVARTIYYHKLIVASYSNVCRKTHLIQGSL